MSFTAERARRVRESSGAIRAACAIDAADFCERAMGVLKVVLNSSADRWVEHSARCYERGQRDPKCPRCEVLDAGYALIDEWNGEER